MGGLGVHAQQPAKTSQTNVVVEVLFYCDGTIYAYNHSNIEYLGPLDSAQVDSLRTVWQCYDVYPPAGTPVYTDTGASFYYRFLQQGVHSLVLSCYCYNDSLQFSKTYLFDNTVTQTTLPVASADTVCPHTLVTIVDATPDSVTTDGRQWWVGSWMLSNVGDSVTLTVDTSVVVTLRYPRYEPIYNLQGVLVDTAQCPVDGQVTVTTAPTVTDYDTLVYCFDTSFLWHGNHLASSGSYSDTHTTRYGCDSSYYLQLTIHPDFVQYDTVVQCSDTAIFYQGHRFDQSGSYTVNYPIASGCDSSYHLYFKQNRTYQFIDTVNSCDGSDYLYHGQSFTVPGDYQLTFATVEGCDSLYSLRLNDYTLSTRWEFSTDGTHWSWDSVPFTSCEPFSLRMRHHSQGVEHARWLLGDSTTSYLTNVHHHYPAGRYSITLLVSNSGGCADTLRFPDAVEVFAIPHAQFDWSPEAVCYTHSEMDLINLSTPIDSNARFLWTIEHEDGYDTLSQWQPHYRWQLNNNVHEQDFSISLAEYYPYVTLRGDTVVCADSVERTITLRNDYLFFPNAVTPNGDGINDEWRIVGLLEFRCFPDNHLYIYNRWGRLIFESHFIDSDDDFWTPPSDIPDGTYYYSFEGKGTCGHVVRRGVIELLR